MTCLPTDYGFSKLALKKSKKACWSSKHHQYHLEMYLVLVIIDIAGEKNHLALNNIQSINHSLHPDVSAFHTETFFF
jgi:hypothetical protein